MGLWQESGAMQHHKFLGEAAEAPEINSARLLVFATRVVFSCMNCENLNELQHHYTSSGKS